MPVFGIETAQKLPYRKNGTLTLKGAMPAFGIETGFLLPHRRLVASFKG
jgi:hypothetical protein